MLHTFWQAWYRALATASEKETFLNREKTILSFGTKHCYTISTHQRSIVSTNKEIRNKFLPHRREIHVCTRWPSHVGLWFTLHVLPQPSQRSRRCANDQQKCVNLSVKALKNKTYWFKREFLQNFKVKNAAVNHLPQKGPPAVKTWTADCKLDRKAMSRDTQRFARNTRS